ncbi:TetR family transcriptional regulator, partial [Streptomyces sp. NPDC055080]
NGLRLWLRSGGAGDPEAAVDHALGMVRDVWGSGVERPVPARAVASGGDEVIVMVAPKGTPMWRVVQQIESVVGQGSAEK